MNFLKENWWIIFSLYLIFSSFYITSIFVIELIKYREAIVWTLTHHWFWMHLSNNFILFTLAYATSVILFLITRKALTHKRSGVEL